MMTETDTVTTGSSAATLRNRRNSGQSSIWQEDSKEYWKKHEQPSSGGSRKGIFLLLGLLVAATAGGGTWYYTQHIIPSVQNKLSSENITSGGIQQQAVHVAPPPPPPPAPLLRAEERDDCRRRAVESAWHQRTCENMCAKHRDTIPRPNMHRACMDGCTFGSIATSKTVCAEGRGNESQDNCQSLIKTDCVRACSPHNMQMPRPAVKNLCVEHCQSVSVPSCRRASQILDQIMETRRELLKKGQK